MRRIGMGLVGPGFAGRHHLDAVRRLGFVEIVAIAASSQASARTAADALDVAKAYPTYQALIADPDVHVIHITTPNYLHAPAANAYTHRPGGHQEAWADAFRNVVHDIYRFIADGRKPADAIDLLARVMLTEPPPDPWCT